MSVAKHTDVLLVKQGDCGGNDLATYRTKLGIRHIMFTDFPNALCTADQSVVKDKKGVDDVPSTGKA